MMLITELIIARTVHIGASILLAGIFYFRSRYAWAGRRAGSDDLHEIQWRLFRLVVWSLVAALFSALLWFWLEVVNMSGLPLTSTFSVTAWQTVLFQTQFGRVWQLRLGLIALAFALVATALER